MPIPTLPDYQSRDWYAWASAIDAAARTIGNTTDASTTAKGVVQLAGDLAGTAAAPTVPGLTAKAPLVSPAFTGTPTAPTASGTDSSTQVATTAFVKGQGYASLVSPAFTGTPTAPTATAGTSTTQVATTAFVAGAIGGTTVTTPPNVQSATGYTLVAADLNKAVEMTNSAANTVTVPTNASVPFVIGAVIEILQYGAGQTSVAGASGVTIRTATSLALRAQYSTVTIRKRATDEWVIAGDLV